MQAKNRKQLKEIAKLRRAHRNLNLNEILIEEELPLPDDSASMGESQQEDTKAVIYVYTDNGHPQMEDIIPESSKFALELADRIQHQHSSNLQQRSKRFSPAKRPGNRKKNRKQRRKTKKNRNNRTLDNRTENGIYTIEISTNRDEVEGTSTESFDQEDPFAVSPSSKKKKRTKNQGKNKQRGNKQQTSRKDYEKETLKVNVQTSIEDHVDFERISCRREDFYIDFEKVGWGDWILYPKRYNAYRCVGECSTVARGDASITNHAYMQSFIATHRLGSVPQPCCVPTRLKSMSIMYHEDGVVKQRDHEEMVVEECGCR